MGPPSSQVGVRPPPTTPFHTAPVTWSSCNRRKPRQNSRVGPNVAPPPKFRTKSSDFLPAQATPNPPALRCVWGSASHRANSPPPEWSVCFIFLRLTPCSDRPPTPPCWGNAGTEAAANGHRPSKGDKAGDRAHHRSRSHSHGHSPVKEGGNVALARKLREEAGTPSPPGWWLGTGWLAAPAWALLLAPAFSKRGTAPQPQS